MILLALSKFAIRLATIFIFNKKRRQAFRKKAFTSCIAWTARRQYATQVSRLKKKIARTPGYKVKVIFLVTEISKWCSQSVYDEMAEDPAFDVAIGVANQEVLLAGTHVSEAYEASVKFFEQLGMKTIRLYDVATGETKPFDKFAPDIVFYPQPWGNHKVHDILRTSQHSLTCYLPYGLQILNNKNNYLDDFHGYIWRYFLESEINLTRFSRKHDVRNCVVTGYPKLDVYIKSSDKELFNGWKQEQVDGRPMRIIYAPHHSFSTPPAFATFQWNGEFLLEYAHAHPETEWIFKPHPRFFIRTIKEGIFTPQELRRYSDGWSNGSNTSTYNEGNYFGIFKESDLLITDCVSFLAEYLPTGKPVIFLRSENETTSFNELGEKVIEYYHHIHTQEELRDVLNKLTIHEEDELKEGRLASIKHLAIGKEKAATRIVGHIKRELRIG